MDNYRSDTKPVLQLFQPMLLDNGQVIGRRISPDTPLPNDCSKTSGKGELLVLVVTLSPTGTAGRGRNGHFVTSGNNPDSSNSI